MNEKYLKNITEKIIEMVINEEPWDHIYQEIKNVYIEGQKDLMRRD